MTKKPKSGDKVPPESTVDGHPGDFIESTVGPHPNEPDEAQLYDLARAALGLAKADVAHYRVYLEALHVVIVTHDRRKLHYYHKVTL